MIHPKSSSKQAEEAQPSTSLPDDSQPAEYVREYEAAREQAAQLADTWARQLRTIGSHAVAAGAEVLAKEIRALLPTEARPPQPTVESPLAEPTKEREL